MQFSRHDNEARQGGGPTEGQARVFHLEQMNIRLVNRVLFLVTVLFAVWVGYQIWQTYRQDTAMVENNTDGDRVAVASAYQEFQDRQVYTEKISRRNIFQPVTAQEQETVEAPVYSSRDEIKKRLEEARSELLVVGVSWREPRMVFLYDKRRNKTYFLTEEQEIGSKTGITVRSISRTKIKIGLEDEEIFL